MLGKPSCRRARRARSRRPAIAASVTPPLPVKAMRSKAPRSASKTRGVDDDVEIVCVVAGPDARGRDALDRVGLAVHQRYVGLVVAFIVLDRIERHAPRVPKPWFFGIRSSATRWSFTRLRILSATNSETARLASRFVSMSLKLPTQNPEALLAVQLLQDRVPLVIADFEGALLHGRVQEAGEGFVAAGEDLRRSGRRICSISSAPIVPLCSGAHQIGRALEDRELRRGLGDFLDRLHARRARADDGDALASEIHGLLRPEPGVEGLALEVFHAPENAAWWARTARRSR